MYYTLSIESKQQIKKNLRLDPSLNEIQKSCCDSQFFSIVLDEINYSNSNIQKDPE